MDNLTKIENFFNPSIKPVPLEIFLKEHSGDSIKVVRKFITSGLVKANNRNERNAKVLLKHNDEIYFQSKRFKYKENKSVRISGNDFCEFLMNDLFKVKILNEIRSRDSKLAIALFVLFVQKESFKTLIESDYNRELGDFIKEVVYSLDLIKVFKLDRQKSKGRLLFKSLINEKVKAEEVMSKLIIDLKNYYQI